MYRDYNFEIECKECGEVLEIPVDLEDYELYMNGMPVSHAFPYLSVDEQTSIRDNLCPHCWNILYGEEEE